MDIEARKIQHSGDFGKPGKLKLFHVKDLQNRCTIDHLFVLLLGTSLLNKSITKLESG